MCLYWLKSNYSMSYTVVFFFFSSRRRHTRYWRDWSSDVCSSDLQEHLGLDVLGAQLARLHLRRVLPEARGLQVVQVAHNRSEERRVGKECRSRWSPYH